MKLPRKHLAWLTALLLFTQCATFGAGTLIPKQSTLKPLSIKNHEVDVVINNGFAQTTVTQTFNNPNNTALEALYAFPLPRNASLSEATATLGETVINGEVLPKQKAEQVYKEERDAGNETGLASQDDYKRFKFAVSPIEAGGEVTITFVYYQALEIDTGMGRYVYPLEEGGTDEPAAQSFWTRNETIENRFAINLELKSGWPVMDIRTPGFSTQTTPISEEDKHHHQVTMVQQGGSLNKDFVLYYRLADNLPGRIEMMPYKRAKDKTGTFMMVVTPGLDLKPLNNGTDYVFILDKSGSMASKIRTLAKGVEMALGKLTADCRFRIVVFDDGARELTRSWQSATAPNIKKHLSRLKSLKASGSTNLFAGLQKGLKDLDADRATSVVLVTDAVTNQGIINPKAFHNLLKKRDIRVFGFLMGNSANWPLMRTICNASGGFYDRVSNSDDIVGKIIQAKSKMTHECLIDAGLKINGVDTHQTNTGHIGKVYRGEQLVFFGRYNEGGKATVKLKASLTGEEKVYQTTFEFPKVSTDNPELERLWAKHRVETLQQLSSMGLAEANEVQQSVQDLGVNYQIVTEETSMVMLSDKDFERRGIERRNKKRISREREAQSRRQQQPIKQYRVDKKKPAFNHNTPSIGNGGGAFDPFTFLVALGLAGAGLFARGKQQ